MATQVETECRIKGGLPVLVIGRIYAAERDVGCGESAEIDDICWLSGKSIPSDMWRDLTDEDYAACQEALLECEV